ncbi:MAG: HlyC/CorC family transporter [Deltaproteobacteria bacterium]|nr:HlyC/CorC family transporter [Deltaproteobacteria bacterium]
MSILGSVLIILACLAVSAFFSGSETALFRLRSHDFDAEGKEAVGPADVAVRDLMASSSRLLVTILLGNNVVNILGVSVASGLAIYLLGVEVGIPVATIVMTCLVLVFCEVLPKAVAARHPRGVSRAVGLPLYILHKMLRPIHGLFDRVIEPLVRRVTGGAESESSLGSEEVLRLARAALDDADDAGSPLAIIGATSNAAEMDVSEIMVPRTEIEAYATDTPVSDLIEKMLEGRYTRAPIYEESIDHVLGVIHLKDLMKLDRAGGKELVGILKPVLRVPERKPILRLLTEMQRAFCHVALVKDEFGVTQGLVTQEDILEEIVGEIRDEFDSEELLTIRKLRDGSFEVLGRVKVLDFNRETGSQVPAEKGDTISGLIFNTLERAPRKGESVSVHGYRLECTDISGSRITRVRILIDPEPTPATTNTPK